MRMPRPIALRTPPWRRSASPDSARRAPDRARRARKTAISRGAEHLLGEALAVPLQRRADAAHVADVGADAVDQAVPRARAMSSRKSPIAWRRPTKSACPIKAWPMCSSATSGSAAIAAVLLGSGRPSRDGAGRPTPPGHGRHSSAGRASGRASRPRARAPARAPWRARRPPTRHWRRRRCGISTHGAPAAALASICRGSASMNSETRHYAAARRAQASRSRAGWPATSRPPSVVSSWRRSGTRQTSAGASPRCDAEHLVGDRGLEVQRHADRGLGRATSSSRTWRRSSRRWKVMMSAPASSASSAACSGSGNEPHARCAG